MMDRGRFIRPRVKYRVEYRILGEFLSKKVEFLLKSGEKKFWKWVLVEYLFDYDP